MLALIKLLRPQQWTKNGFCLAGVVFSDRFRNPADIVAALWIFVAFCLGSSAVYVLNDILDRERDRLHPRKRYRPIAVGAVPVPLAGTVGLLLGVGSLALAAALEPRALICLALYLGNNLAYSIWVKYLAILDVLAIALGFCLRMLAGVYVLAGELPTTWITLCTFFLAFFLAAAKRRSELFRLGTDEADQRPVLSRYSISFLDYMVHSAAIMVVICYALFTTTSGKNPTLVITVPVVFYGVMCYLQQAMLVGEGEEPDMLVLRDIRILLSIVLWLVLYLAITHASVPLFRDMPQQIPPGHR